MAEGIGLAILSLGGSGGAAAAGSAVVISSSVTGAVLATISVASIVGNIALIGAAYAYSSYQAGKLNQGANSSSMDQGRTVTTRDGVAARRLIYGQVLVSGNLVFMHTTGAKNDTLHTIIMLAGHECEELGKIYLDTVEVPLDVNGDATGTFAGNLHIGKHLGAPGQAAESSLVADAPDKWTSAHTLSGCAYLYVRLKYDATKFPNGIPTVTCLVKGKKVYDPRSGLTAWSNNSALIAADFVNDPTWGKRVAQARIVSADLIEAANTCDEVIVLNTIAATAMIVGQTYTIKTLGTTNFPSYGAASNTVGVTFVCTATGAGTGTIAIGVALTESRYTSAGTISSAQDPSAALLDLAGAMAGAIVDTGGVWTVRAGAYRTPTVTFTDSNLVGAITVQPRQSRQDTFNGVRGTYFSPQNAWAAADFPVVKNDTYKAQDGGLRLWKDIQLPFTTSPATAQRLAKIILERGRQQVTVSALYDMAAMQVMPADVVQVTRARLGWAAKQFEITEWGFQTYGDAAAPALGVQMVSRETAAGVWSWADGAETTVDLAPNTALPNPQRVATPTGLALLTDSSTSFLQGDGSFIPRIKASWNTPNDIFVEQGGKYRLEYKKSADATWIIWTEGRGDSLSDFITDVKVGTAYDVRISFENVLGVRSNSSGTPTFNTVAGYTVAGDNVAPATPVGLAAVAGTGKTVSLSWTPNTEVDFNEYAVYRNTVNTFPGAGGKIAKVSASRFVDVNVSISTAYFYWITALDYSENESAQSTSASATPGVITSGSVDGAAPTNPLAPTFSSSTTYLGGDGTLLFRLVVNVGVFQTGAAIQNILYRRNGVTNGWLIADQRSTGGGTTTIDDLTPGVSYDVAAQNFSTFGVGSGVVAATGSPFTSPTASAPSNIAGGGLSKDGVKPALISSTRIYYFGTRVYWAANTDADLSHYEIKATITDADSATDYSWFDLSGNYPCRTRSTEIHLYDATLRAGYVRIRAVNRAGVAGAWSALGNANSSTFAGAGSISSQDSSDLKVSAVKLGASGASSIQQKVGEYGINTVFTTGGGAPTETFTVSLSNRGFTIAPDLCDVTYLSDHSNIGVIYDWGASSSTSATMKVFSLDGTNIAGATPYRVSLTFRQIV
jgi:hypothetical protein